MLETPEERAKNVNIILKDLEEKTKEYDQKDMGEASDAQLKLTVSGNIKVVCSLIEQLCLKEKQDSLSIFNLFPFKKIATAAMEIARREEKSHGATALREDKAEEKALEAAVLDIKSRVLDFLKKKFTPK